MKRLLLVILVIIGLVNRGVAQKEESGKSGWNLGALPAITYDSDLGFQYGGLVNLFDYDDGSIYPEYKQMFYLEISRMTKGSGVNRFYYDSKYLFPGLQFTCDFSYLTDQAYDFYGFNGADAIYNADWEDDSHADYRSRMFYRYQRKLFRLKVDIQGKLSNENWRWLAGANLLNFDISSVNIDKLNKGKSDRKKLPQLSEMPGLFERYQQWGIIKGESVDGGFVPILKAGIVYDSRDNAAYATKGMWTEMTFGACSELLGAEQSFMKLNITHRQYFSLIDKYLSAAVRLAWQSTIAGDVPFYYQGQVLTSVMKGSLSEGLGGSKTLRGIKRNRIIGDAIAYGNVELRSRLYSFTKYRQHFTIGLNAFLDGGRVTDKIDVDLSGFNESGESQEAYFNPGNEQMHWSSGIGLRVVMNTNFIVAFDYGRAFDSQDGNAGFYMGLNYLF